MRGVDSGPYGPFSGPYGPESPSVRLAFSTLASLGGASGAPPRAAPGVLLGPLDRRAALGGLREANAHRRAPDPALHGQPLALGEAVDDLSHAALLPSPLQRGGGGVGESVGGERAGLAAASARAEEPE